MNKFLSILVVTVDITAASFAVGSTEAFAKSQPVYVTITPHLECDTGVVMVEYTIKKAYPQKGKHSYWMFIPQLNAWNIFQPNGDGSFSTYFPASSHLNAQPVLFAFGSDAMNWDGSTSPGNRKLSFVSPGLGFVPDKSC